MVQCLSPCNHDHLLIRKALPQRRWSNAWPSRYRSHGQKRGQKKPHFIASCTAPPRACFNLLVTLLNMNRHVATCKCKMCNIENDQTIVCENGIPHTFGCQNNWIATKLGAHYLGQDQFLFSVWAHSRPSNAFVSGFLSACCCTLALHHHNILRCGVVLCVVLCCVVLCCVVLCCVVLCCVVLCCVVLCCVVLCCVMLCCVVFYCVVLRCAKGAITKRQWPGCLAMGTGKREGRVS